MAETFYQDQTREKKVNLIPILIGVFAVLIVVVSIFTVFKVLYPNSKSSSQKVTTTASTSSAEISGAQDLQKAQNDLDNVNPDAFSTELNLNDKDAAGF